MESQHAILVYHALAPGVQTLPSPRGPLTIQRECDASGYKMRGASRLGCMVGDTGIAFRSSPPVHQSDIIGSSKCGMLAATPATSCRIGRLLLSIRACISLVLTATRRSIAQRQS